MTYILLRKSLPIPAWKEGASLPLLSPTKSRSKACQFCLQNDTKNQGQNQSKFVHGKLIVFVSNFCSKSRPKTVPFFAKKVTQKRTDIVSAL